LVGTGHIYYSVNGGTQLLYDGTSSGGGNITFYTPALPATDPTVVTSFEYFYSYNSGFEIDSGEGTSVNIYNNDGSINLQTTNYGDINLDSTGDVTLTANSAVSWTFDTAGNLTLPANTFAVNYANGTQVSIGGNTGNVTFSNQVVVGTGDQVGSSGLYLAPGTESVANLQYWRVRGGDVATHMHLDTGNNAYFDQYFGDDGKYVKLANTGNVEIGSDDATGNSAQWTFDPYGIVSLPGGGFLGNIFGVTALESAGTGAALIQNANCYVGVAADDSFTVVAASQTWTFSNANAAATLQCPVVAYAALPLANYAAGLRAFVNDSTVISFGDSVAGGASNTVPVWSDGTVWRVG
jgi:hypothetical protein